jgi:arsenate reductase
VERVLYVCGGNIGRSQMAEAFHNNFYGSFSTAYSAGLNQGAIERHRTLPDMLVRLMSEVGIDISGQRPKLLTREMFDSCDSCLVMAGKDACPEYINKSRKVTFWDIEDPRNKDEDKTREIRDIIRDKVRSLYPTFS